MSIRSDAPKIQSTPVKKPTPKIGLQRSKSVQKLPETPSIESRKAKFASHRSKSSGSITKIPSPMEENKINSSISKTETGTMVQQSQHAPKPGGLLKAIQSFKTDTLTNVETSVKTGLSSAQEEFRTESLAKRTIASKDVVKVVNDGNMEEMLSDGVQSASKAYDRALLSANRTVNNTELPNFQKSLKVTLAQSLRKYDGSGSKLKASQTALNDTTFLMNKYGNNSDLMQVMQGMGDLELRKIVSEVIQDSKGYDSKKMAKKAEHYDLLIDTVVNSIKEGFQSQPKGQKGSIVQALDGVRTAALTQMATFDGGSDMAMTVKMKSPQQLVTMLRAKMGHKNDSMLNAMVEGMKSAITDRAGSVTTVDGKKVPSTINLNGTNYGSPKPLGEGGFALAVSYTNPSDANDVIVVKVPKEYYQTLADQPHNAETTRAKQEKLDGFFEETVNEVNAHREMLGPDGHKNIVGLKGVVIDEFGMPFEILENAPNGDMTKITHKMEALQDSGVLSKEMRQLMGTFMLKGSFEGLQHIQSERNAHHFDIKLMNTMLGEDMTPKIIDFGFSGTGLIQEINEHTLDGQDNPIFKSPEMFAAYEKGIINDILTNYPEFTKQDIEDAQSANNRKEPTPPVPPKNPSDVEAMEKYNSDVKVFQEKQAQVTKLKLVYNLYQTAMKDGVKGQLSAKSDTWSMGVMAHQLLIGPEIESIGHKEKFGFRKQEKIQEFGESSGRRVFTTTEDGPPLGPVEFLINDLMHPDPQFRINMETALKSPIFQDERLNSPALKSLMLEITKLPAKPFPPDNYEYYEDRVKKGNASESDIRTHENQKKQYAESLAPYNLKVQEFQRKVAPLLLQLQG